MKKTAFLTILFVYFLTISSKNVEKGSTEMSAIQENTLRTAEHTKKGTYDHFALGVSIFAFLLSGITLYYTIRTFQSQKKTEKNTQRWSAKQERTSINHIATKLILGYRKISAMDKLISKTGYLPTATNFSRLMIDVDELHPNEYYGKGLDYDGIYSLCEHIKEFNSLMESRCDEATYSKLSPDKQFYRPVFFDENGSYFGTERKKIRQLLLFMSDLYPRLFESSEYDKQTIEDKRYIVEFEGRTFRFSRYSSAPMSDYIGSLNVSLETFFQSPYSDFFEMPFIRFLNNFLYDERFPMYYFVDIKDETKEEIRNMYSKLYDEKKEDNINHRLPVIDSYIDIVLRLIEIDSDGYDFEKINDIYYCKSKVEVEADKILGLVDVYDENSKMLYTHTDRETYENIVSFRKAYLTYSISEENFHLFLKHKKGIVLNNTELNDKQKKGKLHIYNRNSFPYILNEIEYVSLTHFSGGCKDTVCIKIDNIVTKAYEPTERDTCNWKISLILGKIEKFNRV